MSADTLTATGSSAVLAAAPDEAGHPSTIVGYVAVPGQHEIVALTASGTSGLTVEYSATAYSTSGAVLFHSTLGDLNTSFLDGLRNASLTLLANGDVAFAWNLVDFSDLAGFSQNHYAVVSPSGQVVTDAAFSLGHETSFPPANPGTFELSSQFAPTLYATATGFDLQWDAAASVVLTSSGVFAHEEQTLSLTGGLEQRTTTRENALNSFPAGMHAFATGWAGAADNLQLSGNTVQYYDGATLHAAATIPNEPAGAITSEAAAMLAGGGAAVAWVDSGTDYVSLFNSSTNSFGPQIGLDWGGASDIHVVALTDGGFAVSWMNGGAYKGEMFDSAGNGGGVISLTGDVAGLDGAGNLYTVGLNSSGQYVTQTYAIDSSGGGAGGWRSGGGSGSGQTFTSDNNGDHWTGTSGDDTFHLGRGGDVVAGNGGNDTFDFAEIPWAGGQITDFNAGDTLDLAGLMSTTHDTGTDGFADGYLKITNDGSGDAQVWARYGNVDGASDGSGTWWLVETLDGVAPSSLQTSGDVVAVASGPTSVSTSDSIYVAPANVTSITLTGSAQHIDASATSGVSITSNNTGNVVIGGAGDDTFHLGRGGDAVAGGAGADIFSYAETPWAGGYITDFNASQGDEIDVSGLLAKSGYSGSDPFADGYLKYTADANGNAELWSDVHQSGNSGWWLVATLDGVSTSSLHYAGGLIT
jgi:RTX calcium-binding nonapeptide repeat (4 copies)